MATPDITSVTMTTIEENRLVELETVVESGLDMFVKVGTALAEIRDSKLYRQTHSSFANYMADRWQISESRGYQLISAAHTSTVVEAAGLPAPTNEAQTRPLSGLNDPEVRAAWGRAVESSPGRPTARDVARAREQVVPLCRREGHGYHGGDGMCPDDRGATPAAEVAPPTPEPTRRRRPLPDAFRRTSYELEKRAESLARLVDDDRWTANADTCRTQSQAEVKFAIDALARVAKRMGLGELVLLTPAMNVMADATDAEFEAALPASRDDDDLSAENVAAHLGGAR